MEILDESEAPEVSVIQELLRIEFRLMSPIETLSIVDLVNVSYDPGSVYLRVSIEMKGVRASRSWVFPVLSDFNPFELSEEGSIVLDTPRRIVHSILFMAGAAIQLVRGESWPDTPLEMAFTESAEAIAESLADRVSSILQGGFDEDLGEEPEDPSLPN